MMTIIIKNWHKFKPFDAMLNPGILIRPELLEDQSWKRLTGDDFKCFIEILILANKSNGEVSDVKTVASSLGMPVRKTQQLLTRLGAWWRLKKPEPLEMPDETEEVTCRRCKGLGILPMSELDPDPENVVKCWVCKGTKKVLALKESSEAKYLVYSDQSQWYDWYNWFQETNLFAVREMDKARAEKRPYPVETEWPPGPKRRLNGGS